MKRRYIIYLVLYLVVIALSAAVCFAQPAGGNGVYVPPGAGPAGPAGPTGPAGPAGPSGKIFTPSTYTGPTFRIASVTNVCNGCGTASATITIPGTNGGDGCTKTTDEAVCIAQGDNSVVTSTTLTQQDVFSQSNGILWSGVRALQSGDTTLDVSSAGHHIWNLACFCVKPNNGGTISIDSHGIADTTIGQSACLSNGTLQKTPAENMTFNIFFEGISGNPGMVGIGVDTAQQGTTVAGQEAWTMFPIFGMMSQSGIMAYGSYRINQNKQPQLLLPFVGTAPTAGNCGIGTIVLF